MTLISFFFRRLVFSETGIAAKQRSARDKGFELIRILCGSKSGGLAVLNKVAVAPMVTTCTACFVTYKQNVLFCFVRCVLHVLGSAYWIYSMYCMYGMYRMCGLYSMYCVCSMYSSLCIAPLANSFPIL